MNGKELLNILGIHSIIQPTRLLIRKTVIHIPTSTARVGYLYHHTTNIGDHRGPLNRINIISMLHTPGTQFRNACARFKPYIFGIRTRRNADLMYI